jgi:CheY-like chemotaxis protein
VGGYGIRGTLSKPPIIDTTDNRRDCSIFDVVLMDLPMPEKNGHTATLAIRADRCFDTLTIMVAPVRTHWKSDRARTSRKIGQPGSRPK